MHSCGPPDLAWHGVAITLRPSEYNERLTRYHRAVSMAHPTKRKQLTQGQMEQNFLVSIKTGGKTYPAAWTQASPSWYFLISYPSTKSQQECSVMLPAVKDPTQVKFRCDTPWSEEVGKTPNELWYIGPPTIDLVGKFVVSKSSKFITPRFLLLTNETLGQVWWSRVLTRFSTAVKLIRNPLLSMSLR